MGLHGASHPGAQLVCCTPSLTKRHKRSPFPVSLDIVIIFVYNCYKNTEKEDVQMLSLAPKFNKLAPVKVPPLWRG